MPKRPAAPAQNVDAAPAAWKQQITDRLSLCYTAEDFVAVLKELTDPEQQRFVVDCALRRIIDANAIRDLALEVKGSPGLRTIVARQLLKHAAHPEALSPGYHQRGKEFTSSWAAGVLVAPPNGCMTITTTPMRPCQTPLSCHKTERQQTSSRHVITPAGPRALSMSGDG